MLSCNLDTSGFIIITWAEWQCFENQPQKQLEQLERLHSEDTPRRLMITNTIESYWILSQKYNRSRTENVTERTRFQNQGRMTLKI